MRAFGWICVLAVCLGSAAGAQAQLSLGGVAGYGADTDGLGDDNVPNPFGVALGARAGYTLDNSLYVGGEGLFYVGFKEGAGRVETSARQLHFVGQVGYEMAAGPLVLRPFGMMGLGLGFINVERFGSDDRETEPNFVWGFGNAILYPIDMFRVGGELRYTGVVGNEDFFGDQSVDAFSFLLAFEVVLGGGGPARAGSGSGNTLPPPPSNPEMGEY